MTHKNIDGLVLNRKEYGDRNVYLTVLTANLGKITLLSKNAKTFHGTVASACQQMTYSSFEYYEKGTTKILVTANVISSFYQIPQDYEKFLLAEYILELASDLSDEGIECENLLRSTLNSLYALHKNLYPANHIKPCLEIHAMADAGYMPDLSICACCGKEQGPFYLDLKNGALVCKECLEGYKLENSLDDNSLIFLPIGVQNAMEYCMQAKPEKLFSFSFSTEEEATDFLEICEIYTLYHLGHTFETLKQYHNKDVSLYDLLGKNNTNA